MSNILIHPNSGLIEFSTGTAGGNTFNANFTGGANAVRFGYDNIGGLNITNYSTGVSGINRFSVDGANGRLFSVTDSLSGSLFSVNDIAGLPIIEAFDDNTVIMGAFNRNDFVLTGNSLGLGGTPNTGTTKLFVSGNVNVSGNLTANNLVFNTGAQTISGLKTFATGISAPNLVFNTGNQTISGLKTFANNISAPNLVFNTGSQTISGLKTFANNIFAPTASFGTNTTQIATTAFVDNAVTSDQIMSTIGSNLITSLKVARSNEQNAGIYYFGTYNNLPSNFIVKTSLGRARVVNPTNGLATQVGGGVAANNITGVLSSAFTNGFPRAFAVISVANGGSVRSENINEISMPNLFITNFDGAGLTGLQSLDLQNNSLTSFSSSGLSNLTSLDLNSNSLTSFSASGMPLYVTFIDLSSNSLTSFSAAGVTEISILDLSNNSLTGVNMANVPVGGYYMHTASYALGLNVSNNNLDSAALNAMYTSLGSGNDSVINVNGNPGTPGDTNIANAKGYTVLGFPPV